MSQPNPLTEFWNSLDQPMRASAELWSAWGEAWQSFISNRTVPAFGAFLDLAADPMTWQESLAPFRQELEDILLLPKLADLPTPDPGLLSVGAPAAELVALAPSYLAALIPMWMTLNERFRRAFAAEQEGGEPIESAGQALELWNSVLDRTLMEFTRSSEFGKLQQRLLKASMQHRIELRHAANRSAAALSLPTRSELDDVYQRLHDLRQEVYRLRQDVRTLKASVGSEVRG